MSKRAEEKAQEYEKSLDYYHYTGDEPSVAYRAGYEQAEKDTIKRAIKWLMDRVNIPYDVETNEDGEPLADSYIDYAKKRLEAANEIADDFRKAMEVE